MDRTSPPKHRGADPPDGLGVERLSNRLLHPEAGRCAVTRTTDNRSLKTNGEAHCSIALYPATGQPVRVGESASAFAARADRVEDELNDL